MSDTIFALATAPGRAAVAVMRISGPGARAALEALAGKAPRARRATRRRLTNARGETLDEALTLWFPAPASYTGEDCVEFHVHGGVAVADAVTGALIDLGLRLAAPGEFTRRAFENGKLDLDQAEAVGDLVDAETQGQARQALGQLEGRLGRRYQAWGDQLLDALAQLEASVDFPDEEIPPDVAERGRASIGRLMSELDLALADEGRGRRVREGYRVALIGAPNAGKSSLINVLTRKEAAIVTPIAGTTRDIIEVPLNLSGYLVVLADTAGLRHSDEVIEAEGVRRARAWAAGADLRLWVVDQSAGDGAWREALELVKPGDLCLLNKNDLPAGDDRRAAMAAAEAAGAEALALSLAEGEAGEVAAWLARRVEADLGGAEFPAATRARHQGLLHEAREALGRALGAIGEPELAAEDVRLAARALSRITGRIDAEAVLSRVFATFCIGK